MVTVFTSTYNRSYCLDKLYNSLKKQEDKNFEWIIIDDGSTDDTYDKICKWKENEDSFEISIKRVRNGGKHRAINIGVSMAKYDAFFFVDSDDYLTEDAVSFINQKWVSIKNDDSYAGISGLRMSVKDGSVIGDIPKFNNFVDATNLQRGAFGLLGDKAEVYKTSILKKYPFPEIDGENFLSESIVFNRIATEGYLLRWYNKGLYYCDYLVDGLTRNMQKRLRQNPKGAAMSVILLGEIYGTESERMKKEVQKYYQLMHDTLLDEEICELLHISLTDLNTFKKNMMKRYKIIEDKLGNSSFAIYGFGSYGQRLYKVLNELNIQPQYVIDKRYEEIEFRPVYSLDMELPYVDKICIALKCIPHTVIDELSEKLPKTEILRMEELI